MAEGLVSVPWAVIAVQVPDDNVSVGCRTGLKSKLNSSDSGTNLYENWLILRPFYYLCLQGQFVACKGQPICL